MPNPSYLTPDDLLINSFGSLDLYHTSNPPADGVDINGRLNVNLLTISAMEDGFIEKPSSSTSGNIAVFDSNGNCVDGNSSISTINTSISGKMSKVSGATSGHIATLNSSGECVDSGSGVGDFLNYTTTAPTSVNTNGIKVCVLSSEPATKYNGWLYIITDS